MIQFSLCYFHMGIRDMYFDRNKILKVLAKIYEGIYHPSIICVTQNQDH